MNSIVLRMIWANDPRQIVHLDRESMFRFRNGSAAIDANQKVDVRVNRIDSVSRLPIRSG